MSERAFVVQVVRFCWCALTALLLFACTNEEAPLVGMRPVPTVVGRSPVEARELLEDAGFSVELTRPNAYCIPTDPLCDGPLDDEALRRLSVETQSGTQGKKRPAGSTITLILGSPVQGATVTEDAGRHRNSPRCSGLGTIRGKFIPRARIADVFGRDMPRRLPLDLSLFRVFEGDDTGATWIGHPCRYVLVLVQRMDSPRRTADWQRLGGTHRGVYLGRAFGDHSLTVQMFRIPDDAVDEVVAAFDV